MYDSSEATKHDHVECEDEDEATIGGFNPHITRAIPASHLSVTTYGGFTGPASNTTQSSNAGEMSTVAQVLTFADKSQVTLAGNITTALSDDEYQFQDATGKITIQIGQQVWDAFAHYIGPNDKIIIYGEVRKNGQLIEVVVSNMELDDTTHPGQGNNQDATHTTAQVKTLNDKVWVIMSGTLVCYLGGDEYLFRDATGEINIKIGQKEWQHFGYSLSQNDVILIYGEVHREKANWQNMHVHMKVITFVNGAPSGQQWSYYGYGYTGPVKIATVAQVKSYDNNALAVLQGTLVRYISTDNYLFRDNTGEITVKIGKKERQSIGYLPVGSGTVEIGGELHRDKKYPTVIHFHAKQINVK